MRIAIILILLSFHLHAEEKAEVSFEESGRIWRETTEKGILPPEVQFVRDHIGYYESVLSYFRDGPGMFNVAQNVENAALNKIFYDSIEDLGHEAIQYELYVLEMALDTGNQDSVRIVEKLIRERYHARLIRGSKIAIQKLKKEELTKEQIDFFTQGLQLALKKIKDHDKWRASEANKPMLSPSNTKGQDKTLKKGISIIEEYLASIEK